jgi:putative ubiquitin-RnfH superfamily antitoxin RatB of RatAB toxin-antitoxin module
MHSMPSEAAPGAMFDVEVCYALPERQTLLSIAVAPGTTLREAIEQSGIVEQCPEIDLSTQTVGIFGKIQPLETPVSAGDRIEIYRPLIVDPKLARQRRVAKSRAGSVDGRRWKTKKAAQG